MIAPPSVTGMAAGPHIATAMTAPPSVTGMAADPHTMAAMTVPPSVTGMAAGLHIATAMIVPPLVTETAADLRTATAMIVHPIAPSAIVNSHPSPTAMTAKSGGLAASESSTAIRSCRARMSKRERRFDGRLLQVSRLIGCREAFFLDQVVDPPDFSRHLRVAIVVSIDDVELTYHRR